MYEQLHATIDDLPSYDMKIAMGDFNAQIGDNIEGWEDIIGSQAMGERTDNGERLLSYCSVNGLKIGGSLFCHKKIHKGTWRSPNGKTVNQIDHICISKRWASAMMDVRSFRGADVATDHYLVVVKLKMKLKKRGICTNKIKAYDVEKLKQPEIRDKYSIELKNRFQALTDIEDLENATHKNDKGDNHSVEQKWECLKNAVNEAAENVIGYRRGTRNERWITQETWDAIDERRALRLKKEQSAKNTEELEQCKTEYRQKDKEVKQRCKRDKRQYIELRAQEAEDAAKAGDSKTLYRIVKDLSGNVTQNPPIRLANGSSTRTFDEQMKRWTEHFQSILNCPEPTILHDFSADEETKLHILDINMKPFTEAEVSTAINKLKNGKAAGIDKIQSELLKNVEIIVPQMTDLCNMIWDNKEVPSDWQCGIIIPLPKKGDLSDCGNWRGITLTSVPGKIFCSLLLSRIKVSVDKILRQEQAGFRPGRSCNEQIYILRQILEKVNAWQKPVILNFIDFKKAFDSVHRETIWQILHLYGFPDKIVDIIRNMYEHSRSAVRMNGTIGEWFKVVTGVRQGCILSPLLFAIVIDWVMNRANCREAGITWVDGKKLSDLDFADDIALICDNHADMQDLTNKVENEAAKVGLQLNGTKCKVMVGGDFVDSTDIQAAGTHLEVVDDFCYLGSYIAGNGGCEKEVKVRIGKAAANFGKLLDVWKTKTISLPVKVKLYESLILSTLLYSAELWPITVTAMKKLEAAHHRWQRKLLGVSWKDKISNNEVRRRTGLQKIETVIQERRLRWLGHVMRMDRERIPHQELQWELEGFKRKPGRPRKNWKDIVTKDLRRMGISWEEAIKISSDRIEWRRCVAQCIYDAG